MFGYESQGSVSTSAVLALQIHILCLFVFQFKYLFIKNMSSGDETDVLVLLGQALYQLSCLSVPFPPCFGSLAQNVLELESPLSQLGSQVCAITPSPCPSFASFVSFCSTLTFVWYSFVPHSGSCCSCSGTYMLFAVHQTSVCI